MSNPREEDTHTHTCISSHDISFSTRVVKGVKHNRLFIADAIRAYALLAVVVYHATGMYSPVSSDPTRHNWWLIAELMRVWTSSCVPLFVMLSGMLLLGKTESILVFLKKRFMKVLIPFAAWIIIHWLYLILVEKNVYAVSDIIKITLHGPVYGHLWYLYTILGLYLATPILRVFCRNSSDPILLYFLLLWAFGNGFIPILEKILACKINLQMTVTTAWVGYFVAGYYFRDQALSPKQIKLALGGIVLSVILTTLGVDKFAIHESWVNIRFLIKFTNINIVVISFLSFLILKSIDYNAGLSFHLKKVVFYLSKASFGVYLVHFIIITNIREGSFPFIVQGWSGLHPIPGIFLTFIVTMAISLSVVSVLQHIPYVKKIVP